MADIKSNLIGWWTMDKSSIDGTTLKDSGPNAMNATLVGNPTSVPGKVGQAMNFDGLTQWANIGDPQNNSSPAPLQFGATDDVTISFWVKMPKPSTIPDSYSRIVYIGGADSGLFYRKATPQLEWKNFTGVANTRAIVPEESLFDNEWYHVIAAHNGATGEELIYINNVLSGTPGSQPNGFAYGSWSISASQGFSFIGNIDDVRIYKRLLSADDRAALYNYRGGKSQKLAPNFNLAPHF